MEVQEKFGRIAKTANEKSKIKKYAVSSVL
jgi:hypothetical protein